GYPFPLLLQGKLDGAGTEALEVASQIVQVELVRISTMLPGALTVAVGQFPGSGWGKADLLPRVYLVPPADGIYDFDLVATKPLRADRALSVRTAVSVWPEVPQTLKGVRVHAKGSAMTAMLKTDVSFRGAGDLDFKSWIGRRLIRDGEPTP